MTANVTGGYVDLGDWLAKWGKVPDSKKKLIPGEPERALKFGLVVNANTREVGYRGVQGENLTGLLTYNRYTRRQSELIWENARATAKKGWVTSEGRWDHAPEKDFQRFTFNADHMDVSDLVTGIFPDVKERGIASGLATGKVALTRPGLHETPFNGEGTITIDDSRFLSNAVLGRLGKVLGIEEIFNDVTFSKVNGDFDVVNNAAVFRGKKAIRLANSSFIYPLDIKMQGQIGPKDSIDLDLQLQFLSKVRNIPIVGAVWGVVNKLVGRALHAHVTGSSKNPDVSLVPRI